MVGGECLGFFNRIRNKIKNAKDVDMQSKELLEWLGIDGNGPRDKLSEITYFTCLKVLAETVGKLPLKLYQETDKGVVKVSNNHSYNVIRFRPNPYMTPSVFWSTVEMNKNHHGNAYVWCRYKGAMLQDLWILPSEDVTIIADNEGYFGKRHKLWYQYIDSETGKEYIYDSDNILHFKTSTTFDGITGLSVRDILKHTVEGNLESQKFMNNLFKHGLTGKAVLQYTGDLDDKAKKRILKGIEDFATGSKNAGKIIPVPLGMQLQPLNIKLTDSQFFELKKYSALQIASAFGIKPNHINNYEKSSYKNSEMQQLSFYVDTLLYPLTQYEQETSYKLLSSMSHKKGYFFKFNVNSILRADFKTQVEGLARCVNNGIYTSNEAREFLDKPWKEGGDQLMVNGNYMPITMIGKQYENKGGGSNA